MPGQDEQQDESDDVADHLAAGGRARHARRRARPRPTRMPAAKIIATNVYRVILPPPMRSASLPPNGREIEPSSGPRNAICAACSDACAAVSPPARKLICSTWPNAKREADERAERADVEEAHHPGVLVAQRLDQRTEVGLLVAQVVHEERGAEGGQRDQRPGRWRRRSRARCCRRWRSPAGRSAG